MKKFISKLLTFYIPIKTVRKSIRKDIYSKFEDFEFSLYYKKQEKILKRIKKKFKNNEKIKVAFLAISDSAFSSKRVFELMLKDKMFDTKLVIIPDTSKGEDYKNQEAKKALEKYTKDYGSENIINACEKLTDFKDEFDIIFTITPYEGATEDIYRVQHFKNSLGIFVPYFITVNVYIHKFVKAVEQLRYFWKIFIEYPDLKEIYEKEGKIKNTVVFGYPRIDELKFVKYNSARKRKKVIVAPHSATIMKNSGIEFGAFYKFEKILLELPKKYPQIDFLYRPHANLFPYLIRDKVKTQQEVDEYINTLKSYPNVTLQIGGDFAFDFVNSDGIIHDSGSFTAEYLVTGHPACYMLKDNEVYEKYFTSFGQKCLDNHYSAYKEQDVYDFIDNVILKGNDYKEQERMKFVDDNLRINFGHVSEEIVNYIKNKISSDI